MHKRFTTSGFTLVELLIVISVIAVLVGLAVTGYAAYIKNARQSQIAATVSAYQQALEGATFEDDAQPELAACLGKDPAGPCCLPYASSTNWVCGNNFNSGYPQTAASHAKIKKYVPSDAPSLPDLKLSLSPCPASISLSQASPCDTKQDITYYQSTPTPDGPIPTLTYYLPSDYDCVSPLTLQFNSGTFMWSKQDGTKFSRRVTSGPQPYTECVVALK